MNTDDYRLGEWIHPRAPLVLPRSSSDTITCETGVVWITQGDSNDYVLNAGQTLELRPSDEVIVAALRDPALVRRTSQQMPAARTAPASVRSTTARGGDGYLDAPATTGNAGA